MPGNIIHSCFHHCTLSCYSVFGFTSSSPFRASIQSLRSVHAQATMYDPKHNTTLPTTHRSGYLENLLPMICSVA